MKNFKIELHEIYKVHGGTLECTLSGFPYDSKDNGDWKRPAMICVGGGGYAWVSKREGEPVANQFLARGFHVFNLYYHTQYEGVGYPEELIELACAVDYIRKNAKELRVNPNEIFAAGFSAGGHLVANLSVDYMNVSKLAGFDLDCKLTGVILGYPVISHKYGHTESFDYLLKEYENKEEMLKKVNLDEMVTENTCPTFIWTTATDSCVPCLNSLAYATALAKNKVSFELHVYPEGEHGLSTCDDEVSFWYQGNYKRFKEWMDDAATFIRMFCEEKY